MRTITKILFGFSILLAVGFLFSQDYSTAPEYWSDLYLKRGIHYYNKRQYVAAIDQFMKSLENQPDYYRARVWLGRAYYYAGFVRNAMVEWQRNIGIGADDYYLQQKLASLEFQSAYRAATDEYDQNYLVVRTSAIPSSPVPRFVSPLSLRMWDQNIYVVAATSHNVLCFNKNGILIQEISKANEEFEFPYDLVFDSQGNLYVTDFGSDSVHKFNHQMEYQFSFGHSGIDEGEFAGPKGITIDSKNNLYIVDSENKRVQKFNTQGTFSLLFSTNNNPAGLYNTPVDITVDDKGNLYVLTVNSDDENGNVLQFDGNGNFKSELGKGQLQQPMGIKWKDHQLWVADAARGIWRYDLKVRGWVEVITKDPSDPESIQQPTDVALDEANIVYLTDDKENIVHLCYPESLRIANLDVNIQSVQTANYPEVLCHLFITDRKGNFIDGLEDGNVNLFEAEVQQSNFNIIKPAAQQRNMAVSLLNCLDLTKDIHQDHLTSLVKGMLKDLTNNDEIEIIHFNNALQSVSMNFTPSKYQPVILDKVINSKPAGEESLFGGALYRGISDVIQKPDYKGAVVIMCTGDVPLQSLYPFGRDIYVNYAKSNHVPIFILNFKSGQYDDDLKYIATMSGGKYLDAYKDNDAINLGDHLRETSEQYYVLSYISSQQDKIANEAIRELRVEINYRGLLGQDKMDFFPEPRD